MVPSGRSITFAALTFKGSIVSSRDSITRNFRIHDMFHEYRRTISRTIVSVGVGTPVIFLKATSKSFLLCLIGLSVTGSARNYINVLSDLDFVKRSTNFRGEQQQVVSVTTIVQWCGGWCAQCLILLVTRD